MTGRRDEERSIVVHGPMTGDANRVEAFPRPLPEMMPDVVARTDVVGPLVVNPAAATAATTTRAAAAAAVSVAPTERVFGLDAFRGLLLLAMNFTFTIPPWGPFAKWMYHTQVPPSATREYIAVAGLTWQDMLFAMFVFTMAAAIPIAGGARLAGGKPYPDIVWGAIRRGFLLLVFALLIGHVNPYWTGDYTRRGNVLAIVGLLVAGAVFVRPEGWSPAVGRAVRRAGWIGVLALLFVVPLLYGQAFAGERRDHIMSALAFVTIAATVIWLFTRHNVGARMAILAGMVVVRAAAPHWPWLGGIWYANPAPWFYQAWYLDLLIVAIPGTVAGELISRWMRAGAAPLGWPAARLAALAALAFSIGPILIVGLYERRYPAATAVALGVVSVALLLLVRRPRGERDVVLAQLFGWAALWLTLGMIAEPFEGGIKKDPQTLGFLLLMTGTALASLGGLLIVADAFRSGRRGLGPVALIGRNALFAYVVLMLGLGHLLWLVGIGDAFTSTWQMATVRSVLLTVAVGGIVWYATRKRWVWKA